MKSYLVIIVGLFSLNLMAQTPEKQYYLSTNVLAPLAGLHFDSPEANVLFPLASNLEYGFTLSGGYYKRSHNLELRLTAGRSNPYNFIPQLQFVYNFFIIDYFKKNSNGLYIGSAVRWWDYHNTHAKTDVHHFTGNLTLGYAVRLNRLVCDVRLNQPLAIVSSSAVDNYGGSSFAFNTSPMPELSPVLPFLSLNVGILLNR
jgi:hypothetical protein